MVEPIPVTREEMATVKRAGIRLTGRALVILLTICAWLAVSNHCALAATTSSTPDSATECPMHSAPPKQKPAADLPCCKTLRAVAVSLEKNAVSSHGAWIPVDFQSATLLLAKSRAGNVPLVTLDTGPPGRDPFVELVLQRSLRAHAPPFRS